MGKDATLPLKGTISNDDLCADLLKFHPRSYQSKFDAYYNGLYEPTAIAEYMDRIKELTDAEEPKPFRGGQRRKQPHKTGQEKQNKMQKTDNPCRKHNGAHQWSDCPGNWRNGR